MKMSLVTLTIPLLAFQASSGLAGDPVWMAHYERLYYSLRNEGLDENLLHGYVYSQFVLDGGVCYRYPAFSKA
jgi:hypothetical protein